MIGKKETKKIFFDKGQNSCYDVYVLRCTLAILFLHIFLTTNSGKISIRGLKPPFHYLRRTTSDRPEVIHFQWRVVRELRGVPIICVCGKFGSDLSFGCIKIRAVNVNALTHVINLKILTR